MDSNKKFERSATNKVLGGVCAGLADYLNIDISLMRVLFVVAALCASFGFWLYIILWIVTPSQQVYQSFDNQQYEEAKVTTQEDNSARMHKGALVTAIVLIGIGLIALLDNFVSISWIWKLWPVILIVLGVVILLNNQKNNKNE